MPETYSFWDLHVAIQDAMGWEDYHLHEFEMLNPETGESDRIGIPAGELYPDLQWLASWEIPIADYFGTETPISLYTYDFGDSWQHSVVLEEILPRATNVDYPRCLAGERACPPEDCGGPYGYYQFLEALQDPRHPEHESMLAWAGGAFDPEQFDANEVSFDDPDLRWTRAFAGEAETIAGTVQRLAEDEAAVRELVTNMREGGSDPVARAENLPLRRDMVTVLTYVRDNRVIGTQSTGNFPLKVVRAVTAEFVHPPQLDHTIGDHTYRLRSEDDVRPLTFLHDLAYVGQLLAYGQGRRWRLTYVGETFLAAHPLAQVRILLTIWWKHVNWQTAHPFSGQDEPSLRLPWITLDHLLDLPVETPIPFEPFADELIEAAGLTWASQDPTHHRMLLHSAVRRTVISVLDDFDVVQPEYRDKPIGTGTYKELVAFQITPFGRRLLETLQ